MRHRVAQYEFGLLARLKRDVVDESLL